jgi:hypothetical protein
MSTTRTRTRTALRALEDQDESVRIAVRALGDMRAGTHPAHPASRAHLISSSGPPADAHAGAHAALHATPALSVASTSSTPAPATPVLSASDDAQRDYIGIPLVDGALRMSAAAYAQGKASSSLVKVCAPPCLHQAWS